MQRLVPIQPRTSPLKFDHFAAKSELSTVSYLSIKAWGAGPSEAESAEAEDAAAAERAPVPRDRDGTALVVRAVTEETVGNPKGRAASANVATSSIPDSPSIGECQQFCRT